MGLIVKGTGMSEVIVPSNIDTSSSTWKWKQSQHLGGGPYFLFRTKENKLESDNFLTTFSWGWGREL